MGAGSNVTLGTKNTVPMTANTSSCPQTRDNTTGLVYQQAPCNNKNALLVTIALCILDDFTYELFTSIGDVPPTPQSYVYKTLLSSDKKRDGVFQLSLSNKDFEMPSKESGLKCNVGIRPYTGMSEGLGIPTTQAGQSQLTLSLQQCVIPTFRVSLVNLKIDKTHSMLS